MDDIDRRIINELQGGFPITERPYEEAARQLGLGEQELISRLHSLVAEGYLSRFGPMYRADRLGGAVTLAAMAVPEDAVDTVAEQLNAFPEVAHNYERDHELNLWFVLAVDDPGRIEEVIEEIQSVSGYRVYNFPKREEFYVGLQLQA